MTVISETKLQELIEEELQEHRDNRPVYQRRKIPVGFKAVGEEGENVGVAEIVVEQMELVSRIVEELDK